MNKIYKLQKYVLPYILNLKEEILNLIYEEFLIYNYLVKIKLKMTCHNIYQDVVIIVQAMSLILLVFLAAMQICMKSVSRANNTFRNFIFANKKN